jgi:uncharacterized protein YyaL (SSP411 family)
VPHFEKMLYDQAQLVLAFLEAAQLTGDVFYSAVVNCRRAMPYLPSRAIGLAT